ATMPGSGSSMTLRITELRIENYRAFTRAWLRLSDLTALLGANGSGKSTLLDALGFVREGVTDSLPNALERRGGFDEICHREGDARSQPRVRVAVGFEFDVRSADASVDTPRSAGEARYPGYDRLGLSDASPRPGAVHRGVYGFELAALESGRGSEVTLETLAT